MTSPTFEAVPMLRIFDLDKAHDFYIGFLGFQVDWTHRFAENFPVYLQVSRGNLVLHLTEHHGDCSPGSTVFVRSTDLDGFQQELAEKDYRYQKPEIEIAPWNAKVMTLTDPFGNRLRFTEMLS